MEDLKAAEKAQAVEYKKSYSLPSGVILIGIGTVFLFAQFGSFNLHNWWALFILIPVVASWGGAFQSVQRHGKVTREAVRGFMGALFPLFVALIFLFNWDWGTVWPGFLILAGLNALAGGWVKD